MDEFKGITEALIWIKNTYAEYKNLPVWAGETSSFFGGGAENISDRFVSSFLFLDKLGIAATYGLDGVVRQQLYGHNAHYNLLDNTMRPNPVFFIFRVRENIFRIIGLLFFIKS